MFAVFGLRAAITRWLSVAGRSAFFCFCAEERPKVRAKFPNYSVGDVAKELGKRWEACTNRTKYEQQAAKEKERYARVRGKLVRACSQLADTSQFPFR